MILYEKRKKLENYSFVIDFWRLQHFDL